VCKPDSHPTLTECLAGVELDEQVETIKLSNSVSAAPIAGCPTRRLRDGKAALHVNWLSIEIADPRPTNFRSS
jgi:hypothetical protein